MPQKNTGKIVGVDVGGTFTDLILLDPDNSDVRLSKVPSTLDNQAFGALSALEEAAEDLASIDLIVHGTTTTTNAVLERKLSRTGLITTQGFRDVLELGRRTRPDAYGMRGEFTPIIPRDLRLEVEERMDAEGRVVTPLREGDVEAAANRLLDQGCESVVIHFLHAYANPDHELRAGELVREIWPNDHVTMGHSLLSESREFERGVTAAVNASVQPLLEVYIRQLVKELASNGYGGEVLVMNGNGGMVSSRLVSREAAKTVMSGPASGVKAAAYTGSRAGFPNLLTYDMGGTSSDVALILDAEPAISNEIEIEYAMPIHVPMVDVRTVGAGGGSIARINAAGLLEVGPESAGAAPGPICYGRGGIQPTISDANLLLGRLNPGKFKSLETSVTIEQVSGIFEQELGQTLGMDAVSAAEAVVRIANTKMAGAIRMVSLSLGADPRDFVLFAFGGAGPLHATALARELAVPRVLIPARPGITNALGCVVADLRHDFVNTINKPLDAVDIKEVHAVFARQIEEGERLINDEKIEIREVSRLFSVDMQFVGQTHVLRVDLDTAAPTVEDLLSAFEEAYFRRFRVELQEIRASLVNVNTSVIGKRSALDLSTLIDPEGRKSALKEAETERRDVYFDGKWKDTPIYWRDYLPADLHLEGPAIIEQMDCTTVLEPGDYADGDADGNIIITIGGLT
ncbi:MAG: hydantoinase/oxoprolinase family protein [Rhodospirillaceae bacterium]|nr:hydantoinase [Rhodospirillaceae bacterium]RPF98760.1 MAG: hydantoinase/oxoprolinase family protein [Rhodospirillaceae bacterium TMED63]RZO38018.1 MAG: hydantoinase/oxoprolinase family protein [Rhodospirillaceae bacterium]